VDGVLHSKFKTCDWAYLEVGAVCEWLNGALCPESAATARVNEVCLLPVLLLVRRQPHS
jgi:hypothetical protein